MSTVEVPIDNFTYNNKSLLEQLYEDCKPEQSLGLAEYLALPVTEQYKNNPERIARLEREARGDFSRRAEPPVTPLPKDSSGADPPLDPQTNEFKDD